MSNTIHVSVWRGAEEGAFQSFEVPRQPSQTVLDVITYIQRNIDPTLSYRFACRVGVCGSCAMTVNGRPRWTCRTHVDKVACEMTEFFDKLDRAEGKFHPTKTRHDDFDFIKPDDKKRKQASAGIECIGCGVCYAACDIVDWNKDYLGPAALNRAWTLVNDERDGGNDVRLAAVAGDAGCHACHSQQGCVEHCPKHLSPTHSIAGLKRETAKAAFKGLLGGDD
jgi:fumarate reductase iron-sulfur subunit